MKLILLFSTSVLLFLLICSLFVTSQKMNHFQLDQAFLTSSLEHPLGTDDNGRDLFWRLAYGARISIGIGLVVTCLNTLTGLLVAFLAGYRGGIFEKLFLIISDILQAFPGLLLATALAAFLTPGVSNLIFILTLTGWVSFARVFRSQIKILKNRDYVLSAKALGGSHFHILFKQILPNLMGPLIVQASFGMAGVILTESSLSFLGLGLPPSVPSWGKMLDQGSSLLLVAPQISLFPGLALMLAVLTFNLWGDFYRGVLFAARADKK